MYGHPQDQEMRLQAEIWRQANPWTINRWRKLFWETSYRTAANQEYFPCQ